MTVYTCESCRHTTSHRLTYDAATGFLSCHTCCEATEEVQVSDNALCTLHKRTMYVVHDSDRTPRYMLYMSRNDEEIGEAMTLDGIIRIADAYQEMYNA